MGTLGNNVARVSRFKQCRDAADVIGDSYETRSCGVIPMWDEMVGAEKSSGTDAFDVFDDFDVLWVMSGVVLNTFIAFKV